MILVFGNNRRQRPLELRCPGGKIVISREPHGTIRLAVVPDAGEVVAQPQGETTIATVLRLLHEERGRP